MTGRGSARVFAPASIANLGPGFDVFGIALEGFGDILEAHRSNEPGVKISIIGFGAESIPVSAEKNSAGVVFLEALTLSGESDGIIAEITKGIPAGKGMGSSGASAAAAAIASRELFKMKLSTKNLVRLAALGEAAVAGSPHADNVSASLLGGFVIVGEDFDVIRLDAPEIGIVIVSPNVNYLNKTKMARALLPEEVPLKDAVKNICNASRMAVVVAIKDPVLFGKSIYDCLIEPYRAQMIPSFYLVKKAALEAGAYGCSIAGGGPSVFAVGEYPLEIGKAMAEAFGEIESEIRVSRPRNLGASVI